MTITFKSATKGVKTLHYVQTQLLLELLTNEMRMILGRAARFRKSGWFKSVSWMETVAREIIGPDLAGGGVDEGWAGVLEDVFAWTMHG